MSARFTLDQISKMSPSVQSQVAAELGRKSALPVSSPTPADKTQPEQNKPVKNSIRQNSAGLNQTEQAFKEYLERNWPGWLLFSQSITLKIGNGVRYTPDFILKWSKDDGKLLAWEVKGFAREDAIVKLKVAASIYPWILFRLVTRKKGEWIIQEVLP